MKIDPSDSPLAVFYRRSVELTHRLQDIHRARLADLSAVAPRPRDRDSADISALGRRLARTAEDTQRP
jgi:hypothetical protein